MAQAPVCTPSCDMSEPEEADFTAKELAFLDCISGCGQAMRTGLVKKLVVKLPVADSLPMDGQPFTREMRSECIDNDHAVTNLLICALDMASSATKRKRKQSIVKEGVNGEAMTADKYDADSGVR